MKGTVKWWSVEKGFGFIAPKEGPTDVFVHHAAIVDRDKSLRAGETVSFDLIESEKGPKAANVKREAA
jgi:CspA family cold shock protein